MSIPDALEYIEYLNGLSQRVSNLNREPGLSSVHRDRLRRLQHNVQDRIKILKKKIKNARLKIINRSNELIKYKTMKQKIQDSRYHNKNYNPRQYLGWYYGSNTNALEKFSNKTLRAMDNVPNVPLGWDAGWNGNGRRNFYLDRPQRYHDERYNTRPNVVVNFPDPDSSS